MRAIFLILAILLIFNFGFADNQAAQPETYFFKVSKSLLGSPPTLQERADFAVSISQNSAEEYIESRIKEYIKDPRFRLKLKVKYDELMLFRPATESYQIDAGSSFDRLVYSVIRENQSWDQLLLGKSFSFSTSFQFNFPINEENFYAGGLNGQLPTLTFEEFFERRFSTKIHTITFPPNDARVAGVITTPRFLSRYVNTALNKNRRRAATVFKVFLCESMAPSVPATDAAGDKQDFEVIFPDHKELSEDQIRANINSNVHGDQPDCNACHYKLDPLGQTFAYSAATLSPMASPGALRYKGTDGRKVDIPLAGFGELATKLTEQPEYAQCQVRHFWNWYVGKDVPVSRAKEAELVTKFNELGRKPQDFVAYLVHLPEYRQRPVALTEDQLLARRAVRVLKNCNACHSTQEEDIDMQAWDMTDLPYGKTAKERARALRKISKALDLEHDGADKDMPPKDSVWKLSSDEFNLLKRWIQKGAPDFDGTPQTNVQDH